MKQFLSTHGRTLALAGVLLPLLALFVYVGLRAGPLAPVPVTVATVESQAVSPPCSASARWRRATRYKIGPTVAGRVKSVAVQVGDRVKAGQVLGEMDPIDLDDRIGALEARCCAPEANVLAAEAQVQDVSARKRFAETQAQRYEKLLEARSVSEEAVEAKRQELQIAEAGLRPRAPIWMRRARKCRAAAPSAMACCGSAPTCVWWPRSPGWSACAPPTPAPRWSPARRWWR
jgi:HlyD family secretion protein